MSSYVSALIEVVKASHKVSYSLNRPDSAAVKPGMVFTTPGFLTGARGRITHGNENITFQDSAMPLVDGHPYVSFSEQVRRPGPPI
jgi:hypothetical protein